MDQSKGKFIVKPITTGLLVVSSALNAALSFVLFWFMIFVTGPHMNDVTMRIGFYVVNAIIISALTAVIAPWILANRHHNRGAAFIALLPVLLIFTAVLAFLTLDSWLNRTFSDAGSISFAAAAVF